MKHKMFSLFILSSLLGSLLSAWDWQPPPTFMVPAEGIWNGGTNQGFPMSFEVNAIGTQLTNLKLKINFNFGYCYGTEEITLPGPIVIKDGLFSWNTSTYAISGGFTTSYHASALYTINNLPVSNSNCSGNISQSGNWLASLPQNTTFADVPLSNWAHDWIERLYNTGITGGCIESILMYCPNGPVTRAEMAVFLMKGIHGRSFVPPAATGEIFSDVPPGYWAAAWIEQLAAEGITGGCGVGLYCPESFVTRDQMAVFLLRSKYGSSHAPPIPNSTTFSDVVPSYWAVAWIEQLAVEGITGGCGTGTYCPKNPVTRAQMAVFLVRTFNLL